MLRPTTRPAHIVVIEDDPVTRARLAAYLRQQHHRVSEAENAARAADLLARLNVPERLWSLPPATFSGGEQQRVNIARGLIADMALLLLDEPTASLDAANRAAVIEPIEAKKAAGVGMLGIFHDTDVRDRVATRIVDVAAFAATGRAAA